MKLSENPFYVLGVSPTASIEVINDKTESLILGGRDETLCSSAAAILTHPIRRLEAELSWFPGLSTTSLVEIYKTMQRDWDAAQRMVFNLKLNNLAQANLALEGIRIHSKTNPELMVNILESLVMTFERIDWDAELALINEDRQKASIPLAKGAEMKSAIAEYRKFLSNFLNTATRGIEPRKRTKLMRRLAEDYSQMGKRECPQLIIDLVNNYEKDVLSEIDKCEYRIDRDCEELKEVLTSDSLNFEKRKAINNFRDDLEEWDLYSQPMQVVALSKGLAHEASESLAKKLRNFYIELWNSGQSDVYVKELVSIIQKVFAEVNTVNSTIQNDKAAIGKMILDIYEPEVGITEQINNYRVKREFEMTTFSGEVISFTEDCMMVNNVSFNYNDIRKIDIIYLGGEALFEIETQDFYGTYYLQKDQEEKLMEFLEINLTELMVLRTLRDLLINNCNLIANIDNNGVTLHFKKKLFTKKEYVLWKNVDAKALGNGYLSLESKLDNKFCRTVHLGNFMSVMFADAVKLLSKMYSEKK